MSVIRSRTDSQLAVQCAVTSTRASLCAPNVYASIRARFGLLRPASARVIQFQKAHKGELRASTLSVSSFHVRVDRSLDNSLEEESIPFRSKRGGGKARTRLTRERATARIITLVSKSPNVAATILECCLLQRWLKRRGRKREGESYPSFLLPTNPFL